MQGTPAARAASIHRAIASSHGQRSSSVSAVPSRILATFAAEWSESPSTNRQCRRCANGDATVVLPLPDTPMTMMTEGAIGLAGRYFGANASFMRSASKSFVPSPVVA